MNRPRGWMVGGAALALVLAVWGAWSWVRMTRELQAVTAAPDSGVLSVDRIAVLLASPDFKERLQARRQIDRLPEDQRVTLLEMLSKDSRAEVRLMAVSGMEPVRAVPRVREILAQLARDPDPDVRASAVRLAGGVP